MTGKTHFIGATTAYLVYIYMTKQVPNNEELISNMLLYGLIGALPDLDQEGSTVGSWLRPISFTFDKFRNSTKGNQWLVDFFEHRGFTHTLVIPALLFWWYWQSKSSTSILYLLAYLSHLILDINNDRGIPLFFPLTWKKIHLLTISTGGKKKNGRKVGINIESILFKILWGVSILVIILIKNNIQLETVVNTVKGVL